MSSDVNFSLTNALVDFGAARRIDPKGLETIQNTHSDEATKTPRFDHLVSDHEQAARVAAQTRARNEAPEPQRPSRPADRRPAPARAEPHRAERPEAPARADDEAEAPARKEDTSSARAESGDCPAKDVAKSDDEAEKPAASDAASTDAKTDGNPEVTGTTVAAATPAATPAVDPSAADVAPQTDTSALFVDPAAAASTGVPTDATAALAETGAVPGATTPVAATATTTAADVPPTSVPAVGSATTGVAAPELEAALLAATVAKAGEAGKTEAQSGVTEATSGAETAEGAETASTTLAAKSGADAKAQLAALLEGENKAMGTDSGKGDKVASVEGTSGKGGAANANLHPTRAAHFAEMLDGFMGASAIHRPADILAGLDRPVAAQAMNRTSDIVRPTPLQMLPIEIGMQAVRGVTSFQIRLDPAELGRVDVKLHIQDNGEVKANLIVDRVDTLNMLRRDASTLQNAFEQAGLKQTPDGLTFSLRGEGQQGQQQEQGRQGGRNASDISDDLALQAQIGEAAMRRVLIPNSSIDRMV